MALSDIIIDKNLYDGYTQFVQSIDLLKIDLQALYKKHINIINNLEELDNYTSISTDEEKALVARQKDNLEMIKDIINIL